MTAWFEKTRDLRVQPGRGRKSTHSDIVEDIITTIVEQSIDNVAGSSSTRAASRNLSIPYSTVQNIMKKMGIIPTQNSLQSAVVAYWQGEAIDNCIDISGKSRSKFIVAMADSMEQWSTFPFKRNSQYP